jgi:predicted transposase/invertase (TIGR01784 family)
MKPSSRDWTFAPSAIPRRYLPQFRYLKIAVNELSKRDLVKIRNAVSTVFYIENSTPDDIVRNRTELVRLLAGVLEREGAAVVDSIVRWMYAAEKISTRTKRIETIDDLTEVSTMWETAVKKWKSRILEQGIEKGIDRGIEQGKLESAEKMVLKGMSDADIRDITGLSVRKIQDARNRISGPRTRHTRLPAKTPKRVKTSAHR